MRALTRLRCSAAAALAVTVLLVPTEASPTASTRGNDHSFAPHVSASGRFVVFESSASDLVPGDTNGATDVFLEDLTTGTIERVSVRSDEGQASGESFAARVSSDGRFVTFSSFAENLAEGDDNGHADVFLRDRTQGITTRSSVLDDGADYPRPASPEQERPEEGGVDVTKASVSDDGGTVTFVGWYCHPDEVCGDSMTGQEVVVRDRGAPSEIVERRQEGRPFPLPALSRDGDRLLLGYDHFAYVYTRGDASPRNAAVGSDGASPGTAAGTPQVRSVDLSADGAAASFEMNFRGMYLVPADRNRANDVFVRSGGRTQRVSVSATGAEGAQPEMRADDPDSGSPSVSGDGRFVAFTSRAPNLVPSDGNLAWDVFVYDRATGEIERVSTAGGGDANGDSVAPSISDDGRVVAFQSFASDIEPDDGNFANDVFVRRLRGEAAIESLGAVPSGDEVHVDGTVFSRGVEMVSEADPLDDGNPGRGGEIVGATVVYRPQLEDLFVRLPVSRMAQTPDTTEGSKGPAAEPGVLYRFTVTVGGTRYEARASNPDRLELYRCAPACLREQELAGGIGTTDHEVVWSIPMDALGAEEGSTLTAMRAVVSQGDSASGPGAQQYDEVSLPDATVPRRSVRLGLVPRGTTPGEADFPTEAPVVDSFSFRGAVPAGGRVGAYDAVARLCWKGECATRSTPVTLGPAQTAPPTSSPGPSPTAPVSPTPTGSPTPAPTASPSPTPGTSPTPGVSPTPSATPSPSDTPPPVAVGSRSTTLTGDAERVTAGDVVTLSGVVADQPPCAGAAGVSLYRQTFGATGFERIASGLAVDAGGRWEHEVEVLRNATYVATPEATATCDPVSSGPLAVRARVKIDARVLRHCDLLHRVEGRMTPAHPGTNVYLGERVDGRWYRRDGDRVGRGGRFELVTSRCTGRLRVLWPKQSPANDRGTTRLNP